MQILGRVGFEILELKCRAREEISNTEWMADVLELVEDGLLLGGEVEEVEQLLDEHLPAIIVEHDILI